MKAFREQTADLWRKCATLTRSDIFGHEDSNRPRYIRADLQWQVEIVALGFVGVNYRPGRLAILSVNPAGGKADYESDSRANEVYERFRALRDPEDFLDSFEQANRAVLTSIQHWGSTARHCDRILDSVRMNFEDIAFLYVVPFRIADDAGTRMKREYLANGFTRHLRRQLDVLTPGHIVAIDRPSERAALGYQRENDTDMRVTYYTRSYSAEQERLKTLCTLSRIHSAEATGY